MVHKGDCLDAIYEEANVEVGYLPPNMTYILQVLDLVVMARSKHTYAG